MALSASTTSGKTPRAEGGGGGKGEQEKLPTGRWVEMPTGLGLGTTW